MDTANALPQLAPAPDMVDSPEAWARLGPGRDRYWFMMCMHVMSELMALRQYLSCKFYLQTRSRDMPEDVKALDKALMLALCKCQVCDNPAVLDHKNATLFPCKRHAGHRVCLAAPGTDKPLQCPVCHVEANMELPQDICNPESVLDVLEMRLINQFVQAAPDVDTRVRLLERMRADVAVQALELDAVPNNTLLHYLVVGLALPGARPDAGVAQKRAQASIQAMGERNTEKAVKGVRVVAQIILDRMKQPFTPPLPPPVGGQRAAVGGARAAAQAAVAASASSHATSPAMSNSDQPLPQPLQAGTKLKWKDPDGNFRTVMATKFGGVCGHNGCQIQRQQDRTLIVSNPPNGQKGWSCARCASNMTSVQLYLACTGQPPPGISAAAVDVAPADVPPVAVDSSSSVGDNFSGFGKKFAKFGDAKRPTGAAAAEDTCEYYEDDDDGGPPASKKRTGPVQFGDMFGKMK